MCKYQIKYYNNKYIELNKMKEIMILNKVLETYLLRKQVNQILQKTINYKLRQRKKEKKT
jgi:hypothetical protein